MDYNILKKQNNNYPQWSHVAPPKFIDNPSGFQPPRNFTFLNLPHTFKKEIDWNYNGHKKLWTYNLNYFDYLHQEVLTKAQGIELIECFIKDFSQVKDGKEPYPTSLRITNWVKFCLKHQLNHKQINTAIHNQTIHLSKNLEYHLLANHLLENAFALTIGAAYVGDEKLFKKGAQLLKQQLAEQILPDGAHYERSPMYHQIILFRLMDTINILTALNKQQVFNNILVNYAAQMLGWIKTVSFDGRYLPLFKDASNGVTPTTEALINYGKTLNILPNEKPLKESGYRKFSEDKYELLVDVGGITPDYQPGHAHADTFSFELYVDKKPIIVDTGTSTYNPGDRRSLERSTKAHNTVNLNGLNSSEVWASHRVAKRPKVNILMDKADEFEAMHDGYKQIGFIHKRKFSKGRYEVVITDDIKQLENKSAKEIEAEACLHFHPETAILFENNAIIINDNVKIEFQGENSINKTSYLYAQEFNALKQGIVFRIGFKNRLITRISFIK